MSAEWQRSARRISANAVKSHDGDPAKAFDDLKKKLLAMSAQR